MQKKQYMDIAAVNTRIEGDSSRQNLSGPMSFTADDVLAAYVKGKIIFQTKLGLC